MKFENCSASSQELGNCLNDSGQLVCRPLRKTNDHLQERTTTPVRAGAITKAIPEFGRWRDVEHHFGIKRGTLYNLLKAGHVRSVSLRKPGQKFGCRLFFLPGIAEYLHGLMEEADSEPK